MDGFKNTTKTQYSTTAGRRFARGGMTVSRNDMAGGEGPMSKPAMVAKYAKGGSVKKGEQKIGRVMEEFTKGKLHSGSKDGPKVKSTKQAVAIALNEARAAGAKIPRVKKAYGGYMDGGSPEAADVLMSRMTKDELAQGAKGVKMAQERLERKSVKRGVPPSSDKPMISQRMKDVGKSIGVVKKAMGGRANMSSEPAAKNTRGLMVRHVPAPKAMPTQPTQPPMLTRTAEPMPTPPPPPPPPPRKVYKEGGVVKKAAGGLTLGNKTVNLPSTGSSLLQPVKLPSNLAPHSQRLTLGTGGLKDGQSITNSKPTLTLGTNRMVDTGKGMRVTKPLTLGTKTLGLKEGGVAKKANGGIMLGTGGLKPGQSITNSPRTLTLGTNRLVDTGNGMRVTKPLTLGNAPMMNVGKTLGTKTLRLKNGGLSAMPKGKGCK